MKLTGKQFEQVRKAILGGYDLGALQMLVRIELDLDLETIAGGDNLSMRVFNLVRWAEQRGLIAELVSAACAVNPNNAALQALSRDAQSWFAPQPPPSNPGEPPPADRPVPATPPAQLFLSYNRQDTAQMEAVRALLQDAGLSVWIDAGLTPGTRSWQAAIETAIRQAQAMLVILSPAAKASEWVNIEVSFALRLGRRVFPVLVAGDETDAVPINLFTTQYVDGRGDLAGPLMAKLLPALRTHLGMASAGSQGAPSGSPAAPAVPNASATPPALLASLRTVLAALYPDEISAQRVVDDAGMDATRISFSGQANNTWHAILQEAEKSSRLDALLTIALGEYGVNQALRAAVRALRPDQAVGPVPSRKAPLLIDFDWVTIPAGEFLMGSDKKQDQKAFGGETPQHKVNLSAYCIARLPVTVAQFGEFIKATGHKTTADEQGSARTWNDKGWSDVKGANWVHPRGPESDVGQKADHPVTCVSWQDAQAFCRWASEQSGQSIRLPSEAEWEKAARGRDGRIYPWGNQRPTPELCNFDDKVGDTTAVGRYPDGASPYGCLDMAGNVWEWTSSLFKPYPYKAEDGREDAAASGSRTLRGGSWFHDQDVRCASRGGSDLDLRPARVGFRVVSPGL